MLMLEFVEVNVGLLHGGEEGLQACRHANDQLAAGLIAINDA